MQRNPDLQSISDAELSGIVRGLMATFQCMEIASTLSPTVSYETAFEYAFNVMSKQIVDEYEARGLRNAA